MIKSHLDLDLRPFCILILDLCSDDEIENRLE